MLNWIISEALGWLIAIVGFALIWPIYKSGFFIRQGLAHKQTLAGVDSTIREARASGTASSPNENYYALKRKALLMLILPVLGLATLATLLSVFADWKAAAVVLAIAVVGFFNVN
jgi:hypothetical protein